MRAQFLFQQPQQRKKVFKILNMAPQIRFEETLNLLMPLIIYCLSTTYFKEVCQDSDDGNKDEYGDDCTTYNKYPKGCGIHDDDDFFANSMCCACKGNFFI